MHVLGGHSPFHMLMSVTRDTQHSMVGQLKHSKPSTQACTASPQLRTAHRRVVGHRVQARLPAARSGATTPSCPTPSGSSSSCRPAAKPRAPPADPGVHHAARAPMPPALSGRLPLGQRSKNRCRHLPPSPAQVTQATVGFRGQLGSNRPLRDASRLRGSCKGPGAARNQLRGHQPALGRPRTWLEPPTQPAEAIASSSATRSAALVSRPARLGLPPGSADMMTKVRCGEGDGAGRER